MDNNYNSRIALLILKHWQNALTPDEKMELELWCNSSPENKAYFEFEIGNHALEQLLQYERNNPGISKDLFNINNGIHDKTHEPVKMRIPFAKAAGLVLAAAVAACIFLIVKVQRSDHNRLPDLDNHVVFKKVDGTSMLVDTVKSYLLIEQGNCLVLLRHNEVRYLPLPVESSGEKQAVFNEIKIPAGKMFRIVLPDVSKVFLNAVSSVRLPVSGAGGSIRSLELTGEGYFDVQPVFRGKDKVPFVVYAKAAAGLSQQITVVGTKFNVNAYGDAAVIKTTLEEGAVKVSDYSKTILLSVGEELQTGKFSSRKIRSDIGNTIAWKDGYFSFSNASVPDVLQDVGRWYGVQIKLEEDILSRITIVGISRSSNIESILTMICDEIKCDYVINGNQILIKHR